jgi:site-specific DNA recombinase
MMRRDLSGRTAILYRRVSSDEQAKDGYSLRAQTEHLRRFCKDAGMTIVAEFEDDGYSAKTFDRPGWRELSAWTSSNRGTPAAADLLLVTKWSRFSRNMQEALTQIEDLRSLGIEAQATEQWVNYSDPNHLYVLAINLVEPDVANRWLSINVKQGMRRAMREGRWVSKPPVGYTRARDAEDRAIMVPHPEQAPLVAGAFELAADPALPIAEVYRRAKRLGLRVGRSRFFKLLKDPVYTGKIEIDAWRDEPAETVAAVHEPIVDERTFARVQLRFENPRRTGERAPRPEFPLRGMLLCPHCQKPVTGSSSKGRGKYYPYYACHRCNRRPKGTTDRRAAGETFRHRAGVVHTAFSGFLGDVQLSHEFAELYRAFSQEEGRKAAASTQRRARQLRKQIADEEERRARAEDLYIDGDLDAAAFERATSRCARRIEDLEGKLDALRQEDPAAFAEHQAFGYDVVSDLTGIWTRGDAEAKAALVGSIWPAGVVFDGDGFGTTPESELIALLAGREAENETAPASDDRGRPVRYAREDSNLRPSEPESDALSS